MIFSTRGVLLGLQSKLRKNSRRIFEFSTMLERKRMMYSLVSGLLLTLSSILRTTSSMNSGISSRKCLRKFLMRLLKRMSERLMILG